MASFQIKQLGIGAIWETTRGAGVKVAVLDTGVNVSEALPGSRIVTMESDGSPQRPIASSHGTCCTSLIASELEDTEGIAPECRVLSYRVTTANDGFSLRRVKEALRAALDAKCDVISCSFSLPKVDDDLRTLVREAHIKGIPVLAAGGNDPDEANEFPEKVPHAIVVGAVDADGAPMTGRHTLWTDVFCLGDQLEVVDGDGQSELTPWEGFSSGATAVVAGVVALVLAPLTPARRRRVGLQLDGLLKVTAIRSPFPQEPGPEELLRLSPSKLFRAAQEAT